MTAVAPADRRSDDGRDDDARSAGRADGSGRPRARSRRSEPARTDGPAGSDDPGVVRLPGGGRSTPRSRIAARPPVPTASTSRPPEPWNTTRSVLGFARSESTRSSTPGSSPSRTVRQQATLRQVSPRPRTCSPRRRRRRRAPSRRYLRAPRGPRARSASGRCPRGTSTGAQVWTDEIASASSSSASRTGTCTTWISGTVATGRHNGNGGSCRSGPAERWRPTRSSTRPAR